MQIKTEELLEAVKTKIAAEVVEKLGQEEKEKILTAGVADAIGNWNFQRAIEDSIKQIAIAEVREYLGNSDVRERIRRNAIAATEQFIGVLDKALLGSLLELMDEGRRDGYSKPKLYKKVRELLGIKDDEK